MAIELNDDQRFRAERLARLKGEKCPRCGSSDLRCGVANVVPGGYMLDLWCQTKEAHPEGVGTLHHFGVNNEEARFIGLHRLAPRTTTGEAQEPIERRSWWRRMFGR